MQLRGAATVSWPTWDQALTLAVVCVVLAQVLRRVRPTRVSAAVIPAARELAFVASLYALWQVAHALPLAQDSGAIERARQVVRLEHAMHLPTELSVQHLVLRHEWLARFTSLYYGTVHVPALIAFVVWLWVRHREVYPRWRNALAILTGLCLFIRFVRVAPPRFLTDLGYIDLSERYGPSIYGPVGTGVSDQFAAMPSIHVGWAAIVSLGIVMAGTSRWRWLFLGHVVITAFVVSASGHHWWLDGIVAVALLGAAIGVDWLVRRVAAARAPDVPAPSSDVDAAPALI